MKLNELDKYFREHLLIDDMAKIDPSMNGVQVGCADASAFEVSKIAFAVDACAESFRRAASEGADMLFVHHGLFWGRPIAVDGDHYARVKTLMDNDIILYAAHLPLDQHPVFGNNAGICSSLGIEEPEPFGDFRGFKIGFKGELPGPLNIDQVLDALGLDRRRALSVLPFGPEKIRTVAVISGGGTDDVYEAMADSVDLYITGDAAHQIYHPCLERGINLICGGHYHTETWGVRLLSEKVSDELGLETVFIDVPTGL